jgi:predicted nucleic acid-binding protein
VVVDSGVLLALWDPDDELHHAAQAAVRRYVAGVQEIVTTNGRLVEVDGRVRILGA